DDVPGDTITNTARVFNTPAIDPAPDNNSATATATLGARVADLGVTKTASTAADSSGANVINGTEITYTIAATNNGPSDATGTVSVSDTIPAHTTFERASGAGWACSLVAGLVTCTTSGINAGSAPEITLVVLADPATPDDTVITNTARVSSADDPNPANDTASKTTAIFFEVG